MSKKVVGIIQARMSSTRLTGKMVKKIGNHNLLDWVILRLKKAKLLDEIILATTNENIDDHLADIAKQYKIKLFRGSENNVLNRFFLASKLFEGCIIVRVCADNPFIDAEEVDSLIDFYLNNEFDYCFNHLNRNDSGYADGFGAEIFSYSILNELNMANLSEDEREHVTKHIWNNSKYSIGFPKVPNYLNYPEIKLDIDTDKDLQYIRNIVKAGVNIESTAAEIIKLVKNYENRIFSHR
jgi:spore coat polysaccharide biosynthesis protein SpsF